MLDAFYGIEGDDVDADTFVMRDEDDISLSWEKKAISKNLVNSYTEHSKKLVKNSSIGKLRNVKLKRPSNADKDQEEGVNQRLELADESDLYLRGEKPKDDDEENGTYAGYDVGDPSIDVNDEQKWAWRVQNLSQS